MGSMRPRPPKALAAFVVIALALMTGSSASANASPGSHVVIYALNCARDAGAVPTLQGNADIPDMPTRDTRLTIANPPRKVAPDVNEFDLILPPGSYSFGLSSGPTDMPATPGKATYIAASCSALFGVVVLPGHDRHVVAPLTPGITIDDADCEVYGTMPVDGVAVALVSPSGHETPGAVDDGAFFFQGLEPRRYYLRLWFSTGSHADQLVDLSDPRAPNGVLCSGENARKHRVHDISVAQLVDLAHRSSLETPQVGDAAMSGDQARAFETAYRYLYASDRPLQIPIERFHTSIYADGRRDVVGLFTTKADGSPTGGGIVLTLDGKTYALLKEESYCPGRPVSATLPPC